MAVGIVKGTILPIGVDLGSSVVKLAQLREADGTFDLIGAGSADVPPRCQGDFQARLDFCASAIRRILPSGGFRGRECIMSIPAAATFVHHVKIPKVPPEQVQEAVLRELQGKLPFPAEEAEIRHIIAGDVVGEGEARLEVIVVAARRSMVMAQLAMARRAKLHVAGINVESCAIVECFARLFRRANDQKRAILFVDLGQSSTQVVLSHGRQIVFARNISVAGCTFDAAIAESLGISPEEAAEIRRKLNGEPETDPRVVEMHSCMADAVDQLVDEITQCLRYYESVFRTSAIERVIFLGGQATDRNLCQLIAQRLNLPAQIGDPLVRTGNMQGGALEAGIDRREPQPCWAVAIGLSLGAMPRP
ncbi:MAG TPA: type IV pilus assembly protein PilM [Phycisphaerae bacterium]|nr:type IV pilus assembly protein PilM [Phycisphaerae bacterium]